MSDNTTPQSKKVKLRLRLRSGLPSYYAPRLQPHRRNFTQSLPITLQLPQIIITSPSPPASPAASNSAIMTFRNRWPQHEFEVIYPSAGKINTQKWAMLPKHLDVLTEEKASDILSMIADATAFRHTLEHDFAFHKDPGDYYQSVAFKLRKVLLHPCWYSSIEGRGQNHKNFIWHYGWMRKREEELCESPPFFS
jgi:hypothetical protein